MGDLIFNIILTANIVIFTTKLILLIGYTILEGHIEYAKRHKYTDNTYRLIDKKTEQMKVLEKINFHINTWFILHGFVIFGIVGCAMIYGGWTATEMVLIGEIFAIVFAVLMIIFVFLGGWFLLEERFGIKLFDKVDDSISDKPMDWLWGFSLTFLLFVASRSIYFIWF